MADTDKPEVTGTSGVDLSKVFDPISGLLEGVGQAINTFVTQRPFWQLLVAYFIGLYTFKVLIEKIGDLIKEDDSGRYEARQMEMLAKLSIIEKYGEKALEGMKKAYNHLKGLQIDDETIQKIMCGLENWRKQSERRRMQAKRMRQWTIRLGVPVIVLLLLACTCKAELVPYLLWSAVAILGLAVVFAIVIAIGSRRGQTHPMTIDLPVSVS